MQRAREGPIYIRGMYRLRRQRARRGLLQAQGLLVLIASAAKSEVIVGVPAACPFQVGQRGANGRSRGGCDQSADQERRGQGQSREVLESSRACKGPGGSTPS